MVKKQDKFYDVIIIGAGISGLTSAALLSKVGISVCVIEQNSMPGGYLAKYENNGYVFDTSIHWLNSCSPKGTVTRIFDLIGSDYPVAQPQKRIKRFVGKNFDFLLTNNPDELKDLLIRKYPDDSKGIEAFFKSAKKLSKPLNRTDEIFRIRETMNFFEQIKYLLYRFRFVLPFLKHITYSGKDGKRKGLGKYFNTPELHDVFANEDDLLSCLIPIAWAYNQDYYNSPVGGSYNYPKWLDYVVNYHGNKLIYNSKVIKINVDEKGSCKSVIYESGNKQEELFCNYIIAACDIGSVYRNMLPEKYLPSKFLEKLNSAELYSSAFIIYISLDCPASAFGFNEEMISFTDCDNLFPNRENIKFSTNELAVFSQSERDKTTVPKGCGSLTVIMPAYLKDNNKWQTEVDENGNHNRGIRYNKLKEIYAETLISRIEEKLSVNIRKNIVSYNVATPITLFRYTNNHDGSMMGAKPGKKNMLSGIAHYKTSVKGLYISGHWAELGGGVPIAIKAAFNATLLVLNKKKHKAFKLYIDYLNEKKNKDEILSSDILLFYDNSWDNK